VRVRFVVGRLEHRLLRSPVIAGWLGGEDVAATRGAWPLAKLSGGGALLQVPAAPGVVLSPTALAALEGPSPSVLVGWPETIVVVRHAGVVVLGDGDIVHFGDLSLDGQRVLRRLGFEYVSQTGGDVAVDMELEERSAMDPARLLRRSGFDAGDRVTPAMAAAQSIQPREAVLDTVRMVPGQTVRAGPYELTLDTAIDHSKRPIAGDAGHGYAYRLRRKSEDVVAPRPTGFPDPLEVLAAEPVIAAARRHGLLDEDEALAGEPDRLTALIGRIEGARGRVPEEMASVGPSPPRLRRLGDNAIAEAARLSRGPDGAPLLGRVAITLFPVGLPVVRREDVRALPGRLRKRH
jgi:hypothetical protein